MSLYRNLKHYQGKRCLSLKTATFIIVVLIVTWYISFYRFKPVDVVYRLPSELYMDNVVLDNYIEHSYSVMCRDTLQHAEFFYSLDKLWNITSCSICRESQRNVSSFVAYSHLFASLKSVFLDRGKFLGMRQGGEDIWNVEMQEESLEYFGIKPGAFVVDCQLNTNCYPYAFFEEFTENEYADENGSMNDIQQHTHLDDYLQNLKFSNNSTYYSTFFKVMTTKIEKQFTIAVTRYEYVNFYHTMTDWFNAFLMMKYFKKSPDETNILFIDAHPKGALDPVWATLFNKYIRLGKMKEPRLFDHLVWSIIGYKSPVYVNMNYHQLPLLNEFQSFFLSQHQVISKHTMKCNKLNILLIWRHDYLAHPRNIAGIVQRKIKNEKEIMDHLLKTFRFYNITGLQLDLLPMRQQLEYITATDVLIGMHGAGLTHAIFLPKTSALIELFPSVSNENIHFQSIARWNKLHYISWHHGDLEDQIETFIDPVTVEELISKAVECMEC